MTRESHIREASVNTSSDGVFRARRKSGRAPDGKVDPGVRMGELLAKRSRLYEEIRNQEAMASKAKKVISELEVELARVEEDIENVNDELK